MAAASPSSWIVNWDTAGAETARLLLGGDRLSRLSRRRARMKNISTSMSVPTKASKRGRSAGLIQDSSFLVNFAHVKGHPSCGFGAAFKNLALGCLAGKSRGAMHDVMHYDQYWFPEKCPDKSLLPQIIAACPFITVLWWIRTIPENLHLHIEAMQPVRTLSAGGAGRQLEDRRRSTSTPSRKPAPSPWISSFPRSRRARPCISTLPRT